MLKKILILSAIAAAAALTALFFAWRLRFAELPLRLAVQNLTGQSVSLEKIDYRPFNRLTVDSLTIGENFRCRRVTVYFNPFKLLFNLKDPAKSLSSVNIEAPWIKLDGNLAKYLDSGKSGAQGALPGIKLSWGEGEITAPALSLKEFTGNIDLAGRIAGKVSAVSAGSKIESGFSLSKTTFSVSGGAGLAVSGPEGSFELHADIINLSRDNYDIEFRLPTAKWGKYDLADSSGSVTYAGSRLRGSFGNRAGRIWFDGENFSKCRYYADIDLSGVSNSVSGTFKAFMQADYDVMKGSAAARGLRVAGANIGDANLNFRSAKGALTADGLLLPSNYSFTLKLDPEHNLSYSCKFDKKQAGTITGSLSPVDLKIDLYGVPFSKLRLPIQEKLDGLLDIKGRVSEKTNITFAARNASIGPMPPTSWKFVVEKDTGPWMLSGRSEKNDWEISGRFKDSSDWAARARLTAFQVRDIMLIAAPGKEIAGLVTGTANYSSANKSGEANAVFEGLSFGKIFEGRGRVAFRVSPEYLTVRDFALYSMKGIAAGNARIGLTAGSNDCNANIRFRNFPAAGALINGPLKLSGEFNAKGGPALTAVLSSPEFKVHDLPARKLKAQIALSGELISVKNLQWEKILSGSIQLTPRNGIIFGKISVRNLSLGYLTDSLNGIFEGDAAISGTASDPNIDLQYSVRDASWKETAFNHSGTLKFSGKSLFCDKIKVISGEDTVEVQGKLYPELDLVCRLPGVTGDRIKRLSGFKGGLSGSFSGEVAIKGPYGDPSVAADITGRNILFNNIALTELQSKGVYRNGSVSFSSAVAKFSDSELRILKDSTVNLKTNSFSMNTELRNVHLGPVDAFGITKLAGAWAESDKGPSLNVTLNTGNLWLNQYNLDQMSFGIKYRDKVVTFVPNSKQQLKISGNLDTSSWPNLIFQRFAINYDNASSFVLDGTLGKNNWDFSASGKSISASVVSELLDSPAAVEGIADLNIIGKGSIDKPHLEGSLNVSAGTVSEIPFDNLNLQFSARQDVLTIMRARLMKKDQFAVVASGYVPFFLTAENKKKVEHNPLDVTFGVEEGSLSLLTGLSKDIKSASGTLRSQLRLTGKMSSPTTNGFLKISGGEISSKKYFEKITGLNISLLWKDNLLTFEDFSGKSGNGTMSLTGRIKFSGFAPEEYNMTWQTTGKTGIKISIPQLPIPSPLIKTDEWELLTNYSHGEPKFQIKLTGKASNPLLSGWIDLENTHFTYPPVKKDSGEEDPLESFWPKLSWNLELRTGKNTWYDNELLSVQAQGFIKLSEKGATPKANGRLEAQRGNISYLGTVFKINRAVFEVVNDDCYLEGEAVAEVAGATSGETDTITMYVDRDKLGARKPRFVSRNNPNLSSEKAFARATGTDPDMYSGADKDFIMRQALVRILDSTLATPVAGTILKKSGLVDNFRVQYNAQKPSSQAAATGNDGSLTFTDLFYGTKYSVEKSLTNDVLLGYAVLFDRFENRLSLRHELEFSYRLKSNLFLKGTYELDSKNPSVLPDRRVTLENQWRFGWTEKKK